MNISIGSTDHTLPTTFIPDSTSVSPDTTRKTEGKSSPTDGPTTAQLLGSTATPSIVTLDSPSSSVNQDSLQGVANDLQSNPPRESIWVLISEVMILSLKQDNQIEKSSDASVTSDSILQIQASQSAANQDKSAAGWALGMGIAGGLVSIGASAVSLGVGIKSMSLTNESAGTYAKLSPYSPKFAEDENPVIKDHLENVEEDEEPKLTPGVKHLGEEYAIKKSDLLTHRSGAFNTLGQAIDGLGQAAGGLLSAVGSSKQDDKRAESEKLQADSTEWQTLVSQLQNFQGAIQQNEQSTNSIIQSVLSAQADQKNIPI